MNFQYVFGNPIPHKKSQKKGVKAVAKSKKPSKISQVVKKKTKVKKASVKVLESKAPKKRRKKKAARKAAAVISKRVAKVTPKKHRKVKKVKISAKQKTSARVSDSKKGKGSEVAKKKKRKSKSKARKAKSSKKRKAPKRRKARKAKKAKASGGGSPKKRRRRRFKLLRGGITSLKPRRRRKKKGRKKLARRKAARVWTSGKQRGLKAPYFGRTYRVKYAAKKGKKRGFARTKLRTNKRLYRNPIGGSMIEQYLGHSQKEAIGLVGGGLAYGAVNSLLMKIPGVSQVHAQLVKVPVIGTALPTLVLGALLVKLGAAKRNALLSQAGAGLVGASIVGIGVNASQLIPGLSPGVAGVDYTAYNGVDFTPMGDAQLGEFENNPADFGQVNTSIPEGLQGFGDAEGRDDADFGEIPEGLGDSQLG